MDKLLTKREAAEILGLSPDTLDYWRRRKFGPPVIKVGGRLRYRPAELERWLDEQTLHGGPATEAEAEEAQ